MSTEQVYIAKLGKLFLLKTADIETLIDAVPAFDTLGVSDFCRIDPPNSSSKERKPKPLVECTEEEWKGSCIYPEIARMIAERFTESPRHHINTLYWEHEDALGKKHDDYDFDDRYKRIQREISHPDYDLLETVYNKFLDVLSVERAAAERHIASKPFMFQPDISEYDACRIQALADEAANGVQTEADHPPNVPAASISTDGQEEVPAINNPGTIAMWRGVAKEYGDNPTKYRARESSPLSKRMAVFLDYLEGMSNTKLKEKHPGRTISRDLEQARTRDVPLLKKLFPSLPPLDLQKPT